MAETLTCLPSVALTGSPHLSAKHRQPLAASPVRRGRMSERVQTELQRRTSDAEFQAEFLAADVVEHLLNLGSMSMNGYTFTPPEVLNDVPDDNRFYPSFGRTRQRIVEGCYHIIHKHGAEIEQECMKVPICDEQLYSNVEDALSTIWQVPRNWGRLVSLFVTAYYLCMRICKEEGKDSSKIQSVIGWLARFLKKNAVPWVVERGGFVGVLYGTTLPSRAAQQKAAAVEDCRSDYTKTSLIVTALGFGAALVVGTVIGR